MAFETLNQLEQELSRLKSVTDEIGKTKDASNNAVIVSENILKQYEKLADEANDLIATVEKINFPEKFESLSDNLLETQDFIKDSTVKLTKYSNETNDKYNLIFGQINNGSKLINEKIDVNIKSVNILHSDLETVNHRIDKTETSLLTLNQAIQNLHTKIDDIDKGVENNYSEISRYQKETNRQMNIIRIILIMNFIVICGAAVGLYLIK